MASGEFIKGNSNYLDELKQPSNLWDNVEGNKKATRDLKSLFNEKKVFDYPKSIG
jgi:adenine-specific DNA-methyltransferase